MRGARGRYHHDLTPLAASDFRRDWLALAHQLDQFTHELPSTSNLPSVPLQPDANTKAEGQMISFHTLLNELYSVSDPDELDSHFPINKRTALRHRLELLLSAVVPSRLRTLYETTLDILNRWERKEQRYGAVLKLREGKSQRSHQTQRLRNNLTAIFEALKNPAFVSGPVVAHVVDRIRSCFDDAGDLGLFVERIQARLLQGLFAIRIRVDSLPGSDEEAVSGLTRACRLIQYVKNDPNLATRFSPLWEQANYIHLGAAWLVRSAGDSNQNVIMAIRYLAFAVQRGVGVAKPLFDTPSASSSVPPSLSAPAHNRLKGPASVGNEEYDRQPDTYALPDHLLPFIVRLLHVAAGCVCLSLLRLDLRSQESSGLNQTSIVLHRDIAAAISRMPFHDMATTPSDAVEGIWNLCDYPYDEAVVKPHGLRRDRGRVKSHPTAK